MVESVKDKVKIIVKELFSVVKIRLAGMDKFVTDKVQNGSVNRNKDLALRL